MSQLMWLYSVPLLLIMAVYLWKRLSKQRSNRNVLEESLATGMTEPASLHPLINKDRCLGCRYCQMACPFEIPKFEWTDRDPYIVKCEFCRDRPGDKRHVAACCEVCPRAAVIQGTREELLLEARRRLEANPERYEPKIYGEKDLGGTQVLYLSHVPFEKLGFRFSEEEAVPELQQTIQHGIYQGFIAPVALYAVLGAVIVALVALLTARPDGEIRYTVTVQVSQGSAFAVGGWE